MQFVILCDIYSIWVVVVHFRNNTNNKELHSINMIVNPQTFTPVSVFRVFWVGIALKADSFNSSVCFQGILGRDCIDSKIASTPVSVFRVCWVGIALKAG